MTEAQVIADALVRAERDRTPIVPLTRSRPFLDVPTAYAVQELVVGKRIQAGESMVGAKLGLTSKVKRAALGIDEPVYGRLTSGMLLPPGEAIRVDRLIHPLAEPEIAFLIGEPLDGPVSFVTAWRAIEAVFPAIEVVDSRYSERFRLPDSVADNAGAARVCLGARSRRPSELVDLRVLGCVFRAGGQLSTAAGGAVMGHPVAALVWLIDALATRGDHLAAGSIVLTGGLVRAAPLRAGQSVTAEFDQLGSVELRCV